MRSVGDSSPLPGSRSNNSIYVKYGPEELSPPRRADDNPTLRVVPEVARGEAICRKASEGLSPIVPYLYYEDAGAAIDFMEKGLRLRNRVRRPQRR